MQVNRNLPGIPCFILPLTLPRFPGTSRLRDSPSIHVQRSSVQFPILSLPSLSRRDPSAYQEETKEFFIKMAGKFPIFALNTHVPELLNKVYFSFNLSSCHSADHQDERYRLGLEVKACLSLVWAES
jgi:hypothetical protein